MIKKTASFALAFITACGVLSGCNSTDKTVTESATETISATSSKEETQQLNTEFSSESTGQDTEFDYGSFCDEYDEGNEDLLNYKCKSEEIHVLYHEVPLPYEENVPVSDIVAQIKKIYNITISEEEFCSCPQFEGMITDGVITGYCSHGWGWNFYNLKSCEIHDSKITLNIEYYGDGVYLIPAIGVCYKFTENADGTVTLVSVEKKYDTGNELGRDSI